MLSCACVFAHVWCSAGCVLDISLSFFTFFFYLLFFLLTDFKGVCDRGGGGGESDSRARFSTKSCALGSHLCCVVLCVFFHCFFFLMPSMHGRDESNALPGIPPPSPLLTNCHCSLSDTCNLRYLRVLLRNKRPLPPSALPPRRCACVCVWVGEKEAKEEGGGRGGRLWMLRCNLVAPRSHLLFVVLLISVFLNVFIKSHERMKARLN
jgi:hypothetical protein